VDVPSLPVVGKTLPPDFWTAFCAAAVYSAKPSRTRAWRDSTMPHGIMGAGADLQTLEDASGNRCVVENFARELDLNTEGINGWDGNTVISADMWAYIWFLAKDPDNQGIAKQWAFIASASDSAPTVDAAWTHKKLISAGRIESDGGSGWAIVPFRHLGTRYEYSGRRLVTEYTAARAQAAQSLAAAVPPQSELANISLLSDVTSGTLTIEAFTTGMSNPMHSAWAGGAKKGEAGGPIYCPNQSIDTAVSMTATATGSLFVVSFYWPEDKEP
jgi:hypothetical protein